MATQPASDEPDVIEAEVVFDGPAAPPAASQRGPLADQPPFRLRELAGLAALVAAADFTIYRSHGMAGFAAFLVAAPLLLTVAAPQLKFGRMFWLAAVMLAALAIKVLWYGSGLQVAAGLALLVAFSMALAGQRPYILEMWAYAWQTIPAGILGLFFYARGASSLGRPVARFNWLHVLLPAGALIVFSALFILANPNLLSVFGENVEYILTLLHERLARFTPSAGEAAFWCAVLWIAAGLLRPMLRGPLMRSSSERDTSDDHGKSTAAPLYKAFRNTLLTLIALFAVYLVFEFTTLWFREFPEGFHYSGYAHEGAAWLTVALAVATVVLSVIFRGAILRDPRAARLRRLAWVWSVQNILLALAIYNRLYIYIDFNGMTRMRIVGLLGITAVLIGFLLVIYKIAASRNFLWLLRSQLAALALVTYVFALLPLDYLVVSYNVRRILAGDVAPSVQISVHPISPEGVSLLQPLTECDDPIIRDGVAALLAARHREAEALSRQRTKLGWTTFQGADCWSLIRLRQGSAEWPKFANHQQQDEAISRFHNYVYQWY